MTSEVAVMNRNGIALAADSAVTVGPDPEKIYTSAEKLFQLAENAPVGIMIYGNTSLMQVPWETIIKTYRAELGSNSFPHLSDYVGSFVRFLKTNTQMFPESDQERLVNQVANSFFLYLRETLINFLKEELDAKTSPDETQVKQRFTKLVRDELAKTMKSPRLEGLPANITQTVKRTYQKVIRDTRIQVFENLPISRLTQRRLTDLIAEIMTRTSLKQAGLHSGIVIGGYGEREHFPSLVEVAICGMILGRPLYSKRDSAKIGDGLVGCISPLAQSEMVDTFLRGIDPDLRSTTEDLVNRVFQGMAKTILDEVKTKYPQFGRDLEKNLEPTLEDLLDQLKQGWHKIQEIFFSDTVMQMVPSQPKDELGAMAESLVNLTKFKRRASKGQETVGGPIDVAVISKGDGFVWVKRKHYFQPDINPRFMARLNRRHSK